MFHGKKIVVVMPAYNAARTLERTYREIPLDVVDDVIVVDDASHDETVSVARSLGLPTFVHAQNRGYGANQKTCYTESLRRGADVTVMLHPDYQYTPRLIAAMVAMIVDGPYDVVLGSRIIGGHARQGGMPLYKYISNRFLTMVQNTLSGSKLSEFHTGYRAFAREVLEIIAAARELGRLRVRQPDARPGDALRFRDRRDLVPDGLFPGGVVDQLLALGDLRAGLSAHRCAALRAATRRCIVPDLLRRRPAARGRSGGGGRGGGPGRNRTGINGFAVRWLSHSPTGPRGTEHRSRPREASAPGGATRCRGPAVRRYRAPMRWLAIFVGGGLGALLRYEFGGLIQRSTGGFFPWGTLVVNATGCLAIGFVATLLEERSALGPTWRLVLLVGMLGGYTTFSTFGLETWRLVESGDWLRAAGNAAGSVLIGIAAVAGGVAVARLAT